VRRILESLLALLFPERCPACAGFMDPGDGLCPTCAASLYPVGAACPTCARPEEIPVGLTCRRCRRRPPPFRHARAAFRYGGELAVAIRRLKYGGGGEAGRPELARPLGRLLAPALARAASVADLIVPVPLHARRLRARGFSQAQALVRAARVLEPLPPVVTGALVRTRPTAEQAGLTRPARLANVAGAFAVPARATDRVRGRSVLLVDDVITTGATAAACARALLAAGAGAVDVIALARAEG
jgi:ComF family protein